MAQTQEKLEESKEVYALEGTLIEACECNVLCPCWIGEDPDNGVCHAIVSYHLDAGRVNGLDVGGLTLVILAFIPGNVLAGNWDIVLLVDDRATPEQRDALVAAFSGQLGGPLGDTAALIGTVKGVESAPIRHEVRNGVGTLEVSGIVDTEMEPYHGPDGSVTTLHNSVFSTVPGSPAWVSKASRNQVAAPKYGMEWEFEGRNAIQSEWKMEYVA